MVQWWKLYVYEEINSFVLRKGFVWYAINKTQNPTEQEENNTLNGH